MIPASEVTDEEGQLLASSMQQALVNLRTGHPTRLPPPLPGYLEQLNPAGRSLLNQVLSCSAIGSPRTVFQALETFIARAKPDELMMTSQIFAHEARLRSFEIIVDFFKSR